MGQSFCLKAGSKFFGILMGLS